MNFEDLIGKTITSVALPMAEGFDDRGWLELTFSDGTGCIIEADYGGYTGESLGEYRRIIGITDNLNLPQELSRLYRDD